MNIINKFVFTQQEYDTIINDLKFDIRNQEKIIFEMFCEGYKNKEIAEKLNITTMTVWRRQKKLIEKIEYLLETGNNLKEIYCVYIHIFPNNKVYIGMTNNISKRWNDGYGYKNNEKMFNDILNYGWSNIEHNIIAENLTYNEALKIESEKIKEYESFDEKYGYNIKK